jgi:tRNA-modifying protein YgfZ
MDGQGSATLMNAQSLRPQVLPDRSVVSVSGDGALAFLHNLLTVDLTVAQPAYGALLTPQGKILHDVFVVPDGHVIWIDVAAAQAADFLKRLRMYRLRAKLDISLVEGKSVAVAPDSKQTGLFYSDPRFDGMGFRGIVDSGSLATGEGYHPLRIALGIADSVSDIGTGDMFVHEANLDQLNGVSFSKGCYVGQEVVSRTHHRSVARKRILPVQFSEVFHGVKEITSGEQSIGTVLSSEGKQGLALVRLDRLAEVTQPLFADHVKLTVHKPVWAKFDVSVPEAAQ